MLIDTVMPILAVAGFIILMIVLVVVGNMFSARRFAETSARLEQQSLERGWQYRSYREGSTTSHNFSGKTGDVSWQIESYYHNSSSSRGSSSSASYTRWWTDAPALSGEAVLLIPNMGNAFQAFGSRGAMPGGGMAAGGVSGGIAGLAGSLIQMFMRFFVTSVLRAAPEDARVFDTIQQVQAGSDALRQRYTVLATSEKTAGRFLDEDAERMLLELVPEQWSDTQKPRVAAVVYWHKGIQLIAQDQIVEMGKLEQLVRLGLALVSGQKPSVWS
jgi:hypothetical protein